MRKVITVIALIGASLVGAAALGASPAQAEQIGPCEVYDAPDAGYDGRTVSVDLHTYLECFKTPVSVG